MKHNLAKVTRSRSVAATVANSNMKLAVAAVPEALAPDHSRVLAYLDSARPATPCLVVDLDIVAGKYRDLRAALPAADVFYAVKANPAPEVLARLVSLGSSFDTASSGEIRQVLAAGAKPAQMLMASALPSRSSASARASSSAIGPPWVLPPSRRCRLSFRLRRGSAPALGGAGGAGRLILERSAAARSRSNGMAGGLGIPSRDVFREASEVSSLAWYDSQISSI